MVRRVIDKNSGNQYAAKFLRYNDAFMKEELMQELEILAMLDHPNIISAIDGYEDKKRLVIVSEMYPLHCKLFFLSQTGCSRFRILGSSKFIKLWSTEFVIFALQLCLSLFVEIITSGSSVVISISLLCLCLDLLNISLLQGI